VDFIVERYGTETLRKIWQGRMRITDEMEASWREAVHHAEPRFLDASKAEAQGCEEMP
jgi:hypothetical protein